MKDYRTLYGPKEYSQVPYLGPYPTKQDVIREIEEKYDEKVKKCLKLFYDREWRVTGWLLITKSRMIFYLVQDVNKFKDARKVVWIIDDIPLRKIKPIVKDENVIDLNGKEVIFSLDEYSADRLINEIKSSTRWLSKSTFIMLGNGIKKKLKSIKKILSNRWVVAIIVTVIGGVITGIILYYVFGIGR